jgi:F0F1-type ATP synthase delta subunit
MITDLITNIASDTVTLLSNEKFVAGSAKTRQAILENTFTKYPENLADYFTSVSIETIARDLAQLSMHIGKKQSILIELKSLKQNGLLQALAADIGRDLLELNVLNKSQLSNWFNARLGENELAKLNKRTLVRELQEFSEKWNGSEATVVQIASSADEESEKNIKQIIQDKIGGIVQIVVNPDLMGGMRVFNKGKLIDQSWRAKLNKFFTAIR